MTEPAIQGESSYCLNLCSLNFSLLNLYLRLCSIAMLIVYK